MEVVIGVSIAVVAVVVVSMITFIVWLMKNHKFAFGKQETPNVIYLQSSQQNTSRPVDLAGAQAAASHMSRTPSIKNELARLFARPSGSNQKNRRTRVRR